MLPLATGGSDSGQTIRTGIDIQSIQRFREIDSRAKDRILDRIFTKSERQYCEKKSNPSQHYAARWAAKEAVKKVTGQVPLTSISIERDEGAPKLHMSETTQQKVSKTLDSNQWDCDISLTHDQTTDIAAATVIFIT
jgi:holo-[acyl-carrier protein] synthase